MDKIQLPIHHESHFADDSGICFFCFYQVVQAHLDVQNAKLWKLSGKAKIPPHNIKKNCVSHFPSVSHIKTVKRPDESFSSPFFFSIPRNRLSTHPQEFQFHDICGQGKALISAEIPRECYHISPQQKTCNWKFERGGNGLRHSSKTWLLDCSILNEDFFSWDHWSLPGAQRCRLLLCGSLQGAEDKKNEKWHCGEAERSCCERIDLLSPKHCLFRLFFFGNAVF